MRLSERVEQLTWILYLLDDVVCDFQAIYRFHIDPDADEFAGLSAVQFWRYASRLPRYDGAVASQIRQWREARDRGQTLTPGVPAGDQTGRMVEATPQNILTDPLLSQYIEYG